MDREQAEQFIAAHELRAAAATDPHKRQQHWESARWYRLKYGIDPPTERPSNEAIFDTLRQCGLDDAVQDFWRFHQGQNDLNGGRAEYQAAYRRLRKLALIVCRTHKRASVWVPMCMYAQPGETPAWAFEEVKPLERGEFKQLEVMT